MKVKTKNKKGFTVTELLISTVLTAILSVIATSLFYQFVAYSNTSIAQNNLDSDLRVLLQRLEAEIIPARKILSSYIPPIEYGSASSTITTTNNRLILELPSYDAPFNSTNRDIAIIEFSPNTSSNLSNPQTGNIGSLLFTYIPAVDSKRKKIIKAKLNSYVNDKEKAPNATFSSYNMFRFYKNVIQDQGSYKVIQLQEVTDPSDYQNATVIQTKIVLKNRFNEEVYNVSQKENYFRLRNAFTGG
ncbi:MAG: hypothetical protein KatS3mg068_1310 [Candidatus Sericytochromatia bacterium]|nr:MAG: hypothetical protein KatS3mg068_1310 [Candidatus Sericytochromatia bacterium]